MSDAGMVTSCPHCDTSFRVHHEQLAKREGQVRCGTCGNVFDAYVTLASDPLPLDVSDLPQLDFGDPAAPAPREGAKPTAHVSFRVELPVDANGDAERPSPRAHTATDAVDQATPATAAPRAPAASAKRAPPRSAPPEPTPSDYLSEDGGDYEFAPVEARRRSRGIRAAVAGALAVLLLLQTLYWYRDDVAGRFPRLMPVLESFCRGVGCAVGWPRQADRIAIESSELQTDPTGTLILTATLRNLAGFTQAQPLLELTLTDGREQPLVRRVLAPTDYLEPNSASVKGIAPGADLAARVHIDPGGINASGYRLFVFYP